MKQLIASHPQPGGRGSEPKSKPQIKTKDTRSEMDDLRSKLVPKNKSLPFNEKDMEGKDADAELKRALDKAFELAEEVENLSHLNEIIAALRLSDFVESVEREKS